MIRLTDFWWNKTHFGYVLSEPITDTTHAYMQKIQRHISRKSTESKGETSHSSPLFLLWSMTALAYYNSTGTKNVVHKRAMILLLADLWCLMRLSIEAHTRDAQK